MELTTWPRPLMLCIVWGSPNEAAFIEYHSPARDLMLVLFRASESPLLLAGRQPHPPGSVETFVEHLNIAGELPLFRILNAFYDADGRILIRQMLLMKFRVGALSADCFITHDHTNQSKSLRYLDLYERTSR